MVEMAKDENEIEDWIKISKIQKWGESKEWKDEKLYKYENETKNQTEIAICYWKLNFPTAVSSTFSFFFSSSDILSTKTE